MNAKPEITPPPLSKTKGDGKRLITGILVFILSIGALGVALTGAIFTDTASVGANDFTTGTIDITSSPTTDFLNNVLMAPGDKAENFLTVTNSGSLQLRYAIQRSATNADSKALRDSLRLRIGLRDTVLNTCDYPYYNADGTTTTLVNDTQLYEGLAFPGTATNTVGDSAQGNQSGDRALAAAASEVLCFSVVLPTSAGNALQNATTVATFDFVSEQTANN